MTPKIVMFTMELGEAPAEVAEGEMGPSKLEEMIKELSTSLSSIKHEQEYMQVVWIRVLLFRILKNHVCVIVIFIRSIFVQVK